MNPLKLLALFFALFATGCIKNDFANCPPKANTTLYFTLTDRENNPLFPAFIHHVELFIYDGNGHQAGRSTVSGKELNLFAGKRLWLAPGTYTVVAWANTTDARSQIMEDANRHYLDRTHNFLIHAVATNDVIENGDPLYYAPATGNTPLTVTVPAKGNVEATAEFRRAHIKMDVTIEGYDPISTRDTTLPLKVEITDLTSRYSFGMEAHGDRVSYVQYASLRDSDRKIFTVSFNIPILDSSSTTQICVTNHAGRLILAPISLREILGDRIKIEEVVHLPVRIKFTQENGLIQAAVTVDLPQWGEGVVKPNV